MRYALVNPVWSFEGSTYFGCAEPHFPLELLSAREMLRAAGHEVLLVDAWMEGLTVDEVRGRLDAFGEDFLVMPTAPSYLFWRCPQPELRVPRQWIEALDRKALHREAKVVLIGPHGSVTPVATLEKTGADVVLRGEPDQTLPLLASQPWEMVAGCVWRDAAGLIHTTQGLGATDMRAVGTLDYSDYPVERHYHLHHIFAGNGADHLRHGAEVEFARGCPYACTFCNKTLFRNKYRERDLSAVLAEIDQLIARGVDYIYFIDEIFGVGKQVRVLLEEIAKRPVSIGFQTRIDLWDEAGIDLLARAHCMSFECGVESITDEGRDAMNKNCRITTDRITELLVYARQRIPWVQANLIKVPEDDPALVAAWQAGLKAAGVWVSEPVPMFPFPGSPEYVTTFGAQPDEQAWERAHAHYLRSFAERGWSDVQAERPLPLEQLEGGCVRVLLTSDTKGGVWNFNETLARELLRMGHAVALVSFGRAPSAAQQAAMEALSGDFYYVSSEAPLEWMEDNARAWSEGAEVLRTVIAAFKPDLLHASQMCFGQMHAGVPVVVTVHSDVMSWAEQTLAPEGIEKLRASAPGAWLARYVEMVRAGLRAADAVVAPTRWMAEMSARLYELAYVPEVVTNGFCVPKLFKTERKRQVVTAGRLWDQAKGIAILNEIKSPMPVVIAGEGEDGAGQLAHEELLRLFSESAIYVACSVYEPFGLAPLEAAACGCCVVARDVASLREVWGDGALYFSSAAELEEVLTSLAGDAARLREAQGRSQQRAGRYSAQSMAEGYLAVYAKALSRYAEAKEQARAMAYA